MGSQKKRKAVDSSQNEKQTRSKSKKTDVAKTLSKNQKSHVLIASNNGKLLDADSFINIFLIMPFTGGEVASLRRTCRWWNTMLTSNTLWKIFFQRDFSPSSSKWVNAFEAYSNSTKEELNKNFVNSSNQEIFWYSQYLSVLRQIPQVIPLPSDVAAKIELESEDEEDSYMDVPFGELESRSTNFSYLRLVIPKSQKVGYQIHKLAAILSILAGNNYYPKTHSKQVEMVKVGISGSQDSPDRTKLIPLLHFCYAVLCGEEDRIFTWQDYQKLKEEFPDVKSNSKQKGRKPKPRGEVQPTFFEVAKQLENPKYSSDMSDDDFWEEDDYYDKFTSSYAEKRTRYTEEPHVGISPNVSGPFKPFVFYLKVQGCQVNRNAFKWMTDERGWAPGFFNASFAWFYHLTLDSTYDCTQQAITVRKLTARELIN